MIIVSDTSPISNLLRIGQLSILKNLYSCVIIPQRVYQELRELTKFGIDFTLIESADWIKTQVIVDQVLALTLLSELDPIVTGKIGRAHV